MQREQIIDRLRAHESELHAAGIAHLRLHGSKARGDDTPASDVDLLADFDQTKLLTLFTLSAIRLRIVDILGMPVDLAQRDMLKEQVKARAEREAIIVF
jgi:predicted nucleotidyltransferase